MKSDCYKYDNCNKTTREYTEYYAVCRLNHRYLNHVTILSFIERMHNNSLIDKESLNLNNNNDTLKVAISTIIIINPCINQQEFN